MGVHNCRSGVVPSGYSGKKIQVQMAARNRKRPKAQKGAGSKQKVGSKEEKIEKIL